MTSIILALCLTLAATGCAVLPLALDRTTLPLSRSVLVKLEEAQRLIDTAEAVQNRNVKAAASGQLRDAHGSVSGAYSRWSNDEAKELPEVRTMVIDE